MNKPILFVDDEPLVLEGIRRSLRADPAAFSALVAVHAGGCFANQIQRHPGFEENSAIDEPLLSRLGLDAQLAS